MMTDQAIREVEVVDAPQGVADDQTDLAAHADERFLAPARSRRAQRWSFLAAVIAVLAVHAILIAAFLWRDRHTPQQVAVATETPVEIIQEPPPPPEPPKPPPPPETKPPPPKEDLSPAFSAPRAPNEEKIETQKTQPKTAAPKAVQPPSDGQPQPKAAAAPPAEQAKSTTKEDAAKEEDKTKPDAEALDKARPNVSPQPKTKDAKAVPKRKQKTPDLLASLSGPSIAPDISFAKPTPKTKIYGGTEDVRWMSQVEAMLESKVSQLPRTSHWQSGGRVMIFFHVDVSGRVISREIIVKSGYPDIDASALRALAAAAPFPPPPPGLERGLLWSTKFDGQLPILHVNKR